MEILENNEPRFHDGKFMGVRTEIERPNYRVNIQRFLLSIVRLRHFTVWRLGCVNRAFRRLFDFKTNKVVIATIIFSSK